VGATLGFLAKQATISHIFIYDIYMYILRAGGKGGAVRRWGVPREAGNYLVFRRSRVTNPCLSRSHAVWG
jgi:hypothetical protein